MEDLTLFYSLFVQDIHHMVFKTTLENVYTTCIIYTYDAYKKECCKKAGIPIVLFIRMNYKQL